MVVRPLVGVAATVRAPVGGRRSALLPESDVHPAVADVVTSPHRVQVASTPSQRGEVRQQPERRAGLAPSCPVQDAPPAAVVLAVAPVDRASACRVRAVGERVAVTVPAPVVQRAHAATRRLPVALIDAAARERDPSADVRVAVLLPAQPVRRAPSARPQVALAPVDRACSLSHSELLPEFAHSPGRLHPSRGLSRLAVDDRHEPITRLRPLGAPASSR